MSTYSRNLKHRQRDGVVHPHGAGLLGGPAAGGVAAWAVQETKLRKSSDLSKARAAAQAAGWGLALDAAVLTDELGTSSGVAVAWDV